MTHEINLKNLFFTFAKVSAMTFGGVYAMLPVIERELIETRRWVDVKTLMDFYAVAQASPGIVAVNVAALAGYRLRGIKGALAAVAGVALPSIIIILTVAIFLENMMEIDFVMRIFAALRICVAALIINAVIPFFKRGITNGFTALLFVLGFCWFLFWGVSPALIVIFCALAYIASAAAQGRLE